MFERFSESARRVVGLANWEALSRRHKYIGTEHLLLALARHGQNNSSPALVYLAAFYDHFSNSLKTLSPDGIAPLDEKLRLPQTQKAKNVMPAAIAAADRFAHDRVEPEHILFGLLADTESTAQKILVASALDPPGLASSLSNLLQQKNTG